MTESLSSAGSRWTATCSGFAAILLWSTTVALVRSVSEQMGAVTGAALVYCVAGAASLFHLGCSREERTQIRQLPRLYLIGCGTLFVGYTFVFFLAIGLAGNRQQVLVVGLLNYLWPALTLLFTVALLGRKAHWLLLPGTLLALAGIFIVLTQGNNVTLQSLMSNLAGNPAAYALGFAAAVSWALYSALTRRWAGGHKAGGLNLFFPITAIPLLLLSFFIEETQAWNHRSGSEVVFLGLTTYLSYRLWDKAMRGGNVVLVAAGSYLTPLLSTIVSCLYLSVAPEPRLWLGCVILVAGSLLSWYSVTENQILDEAQETAHTSAG